MEDVHMEESPIATHSKQSRYDVSSAKPNANIFDGTSISDNPMSTEAVAQHDLQAKIEHYRRYGWTDTLNTSAVQLMYSGNQFGMGDMKNAAEDFLLRELEHATDIAALSVALIGHAHKVGAKRLYQKCLDLVVFDLIAAEYSDSGSDASGESDSSGLSGCSDGEGGESGDDSNGCSSNGDSNGGSSNGGSSTGGSTMGGSETSEESIGTQQKRRQQYSIRNVFTELGEKCPEIMMKITERVVEITEQKRSQEDMGDDDEMA
jgi:hypothetical protein